MTSVDDNSPPAEPRDASPYPGPFSLRSLVPAVLLAALALLASVLGSEGVEWAPGDLALVGAIDLLLLCGLHLSARWLRASNVLMGVIASAMIAALLAVGLRLDAGWLPSRHQLVIGVLFLAIAHQLLLLILTPQPRRAEDARGLLFAGLLALVLGGSLAAYAFQNKPTTRWHLLHRQHAVGLPLYALFSRTIEEEELALKTAARSLVDASDVVSAVEVPRIDASSTNTHVVFVLVDTWRADTLRVNGGAADLMPRMNALATKGAVLTDLHANASWTRASCATIFTGLLPEESGATSFADTLPSAWTTLPEVFQAGGYATAAFVTNWIQVGVKTGFGQGFEHFEELHDVQEVEERLEDGEAHIREQYARAEEVNREVFDWLDGEGRAARADRPLFLYVHYLDPHSPYLAGAEPDTPRDPRERKRSQYRQEIRYTDAHLGDLVDGLTDRLGGNVAFVITSDHGEEFWEHGTWGHGHTLYREQLWVPGIVYQSALETSAVVGEPLELRDLYDLTIALGRETPLDMAKWGAERARTERYASQYLAQAVEAFLPEQRKTVMRRVDASGEALIWSAYGPTREVYQLEEDPGESRNLIGLEAERDEKLERSIDGALRFWVRAAAVQRTQAEIDMLNRLGYGGASAALPENAAGTEE